MLVQAEITEEDGSKHRLSDPEIYSFAVLLLMAGSGTTWKQLGITLAALLDRPALLDSVRADRTLLKGAIEESLRWMPTDPMFSRLGRRGHRFLRRPSAQGLVLHLCIGAANRDPERLGASGRIRPAPAVEARSRLRQRSARLPRHACGARRNVGRDRGSPRPAPQPAVGYRGRSPLALSASMKGGSWRSRWCSTHD